MLDLPTCRVNVVERGAGAPVLLLHGNPDSHTMWDGVTEVLSRRYRCIAADLPGFGGGPDLPDADYSLAGQADFVESLRRALGIEQPLYVVGHDFGGSFVLAWLSAHPERAAAAAVMNTSFFADYRWHFWAKVWRAPVLGELSMAMLNRPLFRRELRRGSPRLPLAHIDAVYARLTPATRRNILRLYRAVDAAAMADWEQRFHAAARRVPLLALWGEGDPFIPDAFADRFGAREVRRFPGAGHWLPVVEPERVGAALADFFAAPPP